MLVVLRLVFFYSKDSFLYDICVGVVFLSEALWDLEAWLIIVSVGTRLLVALDTSPESIFNAMNNMRKVVEYDGMPD